MIADMNVLTVATVEGWLNDRILTCCAHLARFDRYAAIFQEPRMIPYGIAWTLGSGEQAIVPFVLTHLLSHLRVQILNKSERAALIYGLSALEDFKNLIALNNDLLALATHLLDSLSPHNDEGEIV